MSKRILRINALIKEVLSQLILREIEFPSNILVTVTRVATSADLRESKVFISTIPEEKLDKVLQILNKKIYFLQQKFNQKVKMKPLPRLKFFPEEKTAEAAKVEEILEELKSKR